MNAGLQKWVDGMSDEQVEFASIVIAAVITLAAVALLVGVFYFSSALSRDVVDAGVGTRNADRFAQGQVAHAERTAREYMTFRLCAYDDPGVDCSVVWAD